MVLIMTKLYKEPLLGNYIYYFPHYITTYRKYLVFNL